MITMDRVTYADTRAELERVNAEMAPHGLSIAMEFVGARASLVLLNSRHERAELATDLSALQVLATLARVVRVVQVVA